MLYDQSSSNIKHNPLLNLRKKTRMVEQIGLYLINDAETTTNFNKRKIQYQFLNDFIWDFMEMDLQQIMTLSIIYQQRDHQRY